MPSNSHSQPAPRVGNLSGRRRSAVSGTAGSSQPTTRVGNLSGRRRDVIPDTTGSSQPTPRVGNLSGRRRDVAPTAVGSGSGTRENESGNSHATLSSNRSSSGNSSPPPIAGRLRGRPPKRPRKSTTQTTGYTESESEQDGQRVEAIRLSDDSSDEYQISQLGDETELDTEPDAERLDSADDAPSRRRRGTPVAERQGNKRPRTVRISTISGSQDATLTRGTPAARVNIIRGRAYTPPTFPSSDAVQCSPLGITSTTTSGVRSSSVPGEQSTLRPRRAWPGADSRRDNVTGVEGEILGVAKTLILQHTLFVDPLPNSVVLTSEVHSVWSRAQNEIANAGNIEPSQQSIYLIRQKQSGVRAQFVWHIKKEIRKLYGLPEDPTATARRVEYLLEEDRFMCPPCGYERITYRFLAPQIIDAIYGKYFDGKRMLGIQDPAFLERINGTMICLTCAILCHALRAFRTGVFQEPPDFKPDVVGDLFLRQKNTWRGFRRTTRELILRNLRETITDRIQKEHLVLQERREGFADNNDAVDAELERLLSSRNQGRAAARARAPISAAAGGLDRQLERWRASQESDREFEFSQTAFARGIRVLDCDLAGPDDDPQEPVAGLERGGAVSPDQASRLSLSLDYVHESQAIAGGNVDSRGSNEGADDGRSNGV